MGDTYRIVGTVLGVSDLYVDATVQNVDVDGNVSLEEDTSNPQTWTTTLEEFHDWQDRTLAAERATLNAPDHAIWTALENAYSERTDDPHANGAPSLQSDIVSATKTVLYEQSR